MSPQDANLHSNLVNSCRRRSSNVQAHTATLVADGLAPCLAPLVRPAEGDLQWTADAAHGGLQQQSHGRIAQQQHHRLCMSDLAGPSSDINGNGHARSVPQHDSCNDRHGRSDGAAGCRTATGSYASVTWQQITARIKSCASWQEVCVLATMIWLPEQQHHTHKEWQHVQDSCEAEQWVMSV